MAEQRHEHIDAVTGTATTGHEWDGIRELNTPLPRWWLWLFYATIVWSIGYWIVYPAWPLRLRLHARACSAGIRAAAIVERPRGAQGAARADGRQARRRPRCRRSSTTRSCSPLRGRRRRPPSTRIARPAMAPAAAAPRAIPISTMTSGCGAASSTTSRRPSATASARATPRRRHGAHAGLRPRRHAQARRHRDRRRLCALARGPAGRRRRPTSPPARSSSPTIAPPATARPARASASSARPT